MGNVAYEDNLAEIKKSQILYLVIIQGCESVLNKVRTKFLFIVPVSV